MESTLSSWSSRFYTWPKSQDKNVNILRTKRAFKVKWKAFFIIFEGFSFAKTCFKPDIAPLRDTLEKTLKVISDLNLFSKFQSWWLTAIQKMNSKDKAFLEKVSAKESSNLVGLGNFGSPGFSITVVLGGTPHIIQKVSKSPPISTHEAYLYVKKLTCCFEWLWTRLTTFTWNDWRNVSLLYLPYHIQKLTSSLNSFLR